MFRASRGVTTGAALLAATTRRVFHSTHMGLRATALILGAILGCIVAGCGAPPLPSWLVRYYNGIPPAASAGKPRDDALWTTSGEMAVITWGSTGCPDLPTQLAVPASNRLTVTAKPYDPSGAACIADDGPTTSVIKVPSALSSTEDVTVTIVDDYGATVSLPPRDSAGT